MIVRRAAPADARAIAEVHVRTWQAAYRHAFPAEVLEALSVEERATSWRRGIEEGLPVWLAVDSGTAVGFASAGPSRTEESAGELYAISCFPRSGEAAPGAG